MSMSWSNLESLPLISHSVLQVPILSDTLQGFYQLLSPLGSFQPCKPDHGPEFILILFVTPQVQLTTLTSSIESEYTRCLIWTKNK